MHFQDLKLIDPLLRAVTEQGYTEPTPIQEKAIPHVLAGRDLIGLAQTGTGKTAAFALPILQNLLAKGELPPRNKRIIKVLVLAPTRELALQIGESFDIYGKYTPLKQTTIFGGVGQNPQVAALRRRVDIVVATPGRLLDLMGQKEIRLDRIDVLILDEADRMLDMGFLRDVKRILADLPTQRQTLLFSATMSPEIQKLSNDILIDPIQVAVTPESTTVEAIDQHVYFVEKSDKQKLLRHLYHEMGMERVLVFTRTKHGANRLSQQLSKYNINSAAIHGNKSQTARQKALADFKRGKVKVLVATDIVARGIDVDDVSHVINFDLPNETESYVHRIGRTGRAGATGIAVAFCMQDERPLLVDIERAIKMHIPVVADHPFASEHGVPAPTDLVKKRGGGSTHKKKPSSSGQRRPNSQSRQGSGGKSKRRNRRPSKRVPS